MPTGPLRAYGRELDRQPRAGASRPSRIHGPARSQESALDRTDCSLGCVRNQLSARPRVSDHTAARTPCPRRSQPALVIETPAPSDVPRSRNEHRAWSIPRIRGSPLPPRASEPIRRPVGPRTPMPPLPTSSRQVSARRPAWVKDPRERDTSLGLYKGRVADTAMLAADRSLAEPSIKKGLAWRPLSG